MGGNREKRVLNRMEQKMGREDRLLLRRLEGKPKRHILRKVLLGTVSLFCLMLIVGYFVFDVGNWQKLDLNKILGAPQTGVLYDKNGTFIREEFVVQNDAIMMYPPFLSDSYKE